MLKSFFDESKIEAGCDEAGRGCLAGPLVCAAVILPKNFTHPLLNDSKKLTEKQRKELKPIIEKEALAYKVHFVSISEIASLNILHASLNGMQKAALDLTIRPELLLIDGNKTPKIQEIPAVALVKGDANYLNIAAASILAKTYRDEFMENLHLQYPQYNWKRNKGYPTKDHRKNIELFGACMHHRMTFNLLGTKQKKMNLE
jgi:ribonuclease HII